MKIYLKPERGYHMINTNVFDYVNVLDKAADAAWMRNNAISNNISNATTPGYKRQDVAFESELAKAIGRSSSTANLDQRVAAEKRNYTQGLHGPDGLFLQTGWQQRGY